MIPFDLYNADVAGYQFFYFLLIVKALYLILYNYYQSKIKFRVRLFKLIRIIYFFVIIPLYLLWIGIAVRQYFNEDYNDFKINRIYWKVATLLVILINLGIILFLLHPTVKRGLNFLKKKDRNEVKYQSLFKKVRTYIFVLIFIDVPMLMFLNRVVS